MTRSPRLAALGASIVLLAGCGASPSARSSPAAAATAGSPASSPAAGSATRTTLEAVYGRLYPSSAGGGDCVGGTSSPSWAACPLTPRLVTALDAAISAQSGPGAEPLCGCQAFDPHQTATYSPGVPSGGGTIHVTGFGAPHISYRVIPSGGGFLVDDIIYCSPSPHSIYPTETVAAC